MWDSGRDFFRSSFVGVGGRKEGTCEDTGMEVVS